MCELYAVMPVYNEEASLPGVIAEWLPVFRSLGVEFRFDCLNDGSKDRSLEILREHQRENPELIVCDKPNTGHGQTCLLGYRRGLEAGARYIFQIDSDGQCEPSAFPRVWAAKDDAPAVYGNRTVRLDGAHRKWISKIVSLVTWLGTGVWVPDPNVPYRLMSSYIVERALPYIPPDFHLANVAVAAVHTRQRAIRWVNIPFRPRSGGQPSVPFKGFAARGLQLYRQLKGLPLPG